METEERLLDVTESHDLTKHVTNYTTLKKDKKWFSDYGQGLCPTCGVAPRFEEVTIPEGATYQSIKEIYSNNWGSI